MIVGSLPKPAWLADPNELRAAWRQEGEAWRQGTEDAVRLAVLAQREAGMDLVTDGEQRRQHYISYFIHGLQGFDFNRMVDKQTRGGKYTASVPTVVDKIRWPGPVQLADLRALMAYAKGPVKFTLPGPMTIADTSFAEGVYRDPETYVMDLAAAVNQEVRALAELGPDIIQIDEPVFNAELEKTKAYGIAALDRAIEGVACTTAVHVCYGYGTESVLRWKSANTKWDQYDFLLPLLAQSHISQLSLEFAASKLEPKVLALAGDKEIAFGCVDVSPAPAEAAEVVAARIRGALAYVPAARLYPSTDCGLVPLGRDLAGAKMRSLAQAAEIVRREL
ncbi:MAG TPA: methionine synthase [Chloroflexota bacterium]|nr:methionine synthase [Chloroflexota bacterium]